MAGRIQSIERAVAILQFLEGAGEPLDLHEIASGLDMAKTTAHGIITTLRDLGLVDQGGSGNQYSVSETTERFGRGGPDPHELRSLSMNWADSLAARTGLPVLLGVPDGDAVRIVHHVFRPDGTSQRLCVDEALPLHASALGKAVLAFATGQARRPNALDLEPYTRHTIGTQRELDRALQTVRARGYAIENRELEFDQASIAAPVRGLGGLAVGAISVHGECDKFFRMSALPDRDVVAATTGTAAAISREVVRKW